MSKENQRQFDEINRPRNEELFNNIHKQYQELAKVKTKDEQIEEMAKIFCGMKSGCDGCMWSKVHCKERNYAEEIYNAGYRKQEWISVEERLPERIGKYLVFTVDRRIYICNFINHYCHGNAQFDDYKVTHWMPLPEAPKMKGGE